jgi:hypothetical protein
MKQLRAWLPRSLHVLPQRHWTTIIHPISEGFIFTVSPVPKKGGGGMFAYKLETLFHWVYLNLYSAAEFENGAPQKRIQKRDVMKIILFGQGNASAFLASSKLRGVDKLTL